MKAQMLEVNLLVRANAPVIIPIPDIPVQIRSAETEEFKGLISDANGKAKTLLMPTNSFWVYYSDALGKHSFRVHVNYSDRRPGHPHNHKLIDVEIVLGGL